MTALDLIVLEQSSDSLKRDLELICHDCGERLCDAEDGDSIEVLVTMALEHLAIKHGLVPYVEVKA